jgi:hypothetical protein
MKRLQKNFYIYKSTEYYEIIECLLEHSTHPDFNASVIKLLSSHSLSSLYAGVWLSEMMGTKGCLFFSYLKELIYSKHSEIRFEVCECYLECANTGFLVTTFLMCMNDSEQCIRIRVIDYIQYCSVEQIEMAFDYVGQYDEYKNLKYGLSLLKSLSKRIFKEKEIYNLIVLTNISEEKKMLFVVALKLGWNTKQCYKLALHSKNDDLIYYAKIRL